MHKKIESQYMIFLEESWYMYVRNLEYARDKFVKLFFIFIGYSTAEKKKKKGNALSHEFILRGKFTNAFNYRIKNWPAKAQQIRMGTWRHVYQETQVVWRCQTDNYHYLLILILL